MPAIICFIPAPDGNTGPCMTARFFNENYMIHIGDTNHIT